MEQALKPVAITYRGNDADHHVIDAVQAGPSITGAARLYNSVNYLYLNGSLPNKRTVYPMKVYVGPPKEGSLTYVFIASMFYGQIVGYAPILCELADMAIPKIIGAIFSRKSGQNDQVDKALEIIKTMHADHHELAQTAIASAMADKNQLLNTIDKLVDFNRVALSDMVKPIGSSCRTMTHYDGDSNSVVIDEPIAVAMRSKEELEVGAQAEFVGTILGVDTATGACHVRFMDGNEIRGKVTDPSLRQAGNVYTSALNAQSVVVLTAKPVLKGGELSRLYISDAKKTS